MFERPRPARPLLGPLLAALVLTAVGFLTLHACTGGQKRARKSSSKWEVHERADTGGSWRGLSGLAVAPDGQLWTVAERQRALLKLGVDGPGLTTTSLPLEGIPAGVDLDTESIAFLAPDRVALGTETHGLLPRASDPILLVELRPDRGVVVDRLELPYELWQTRAENNRGLEGLCAAGGLLVAGAEHTLEQDGRRYAPIAFRDLSAGTWTAARLELTSKRGKLSSLACQELGDGRLELLAIERHYGVSRILRVRIPPGPPPEVLEPKLLVDLEHLFEPLPNFEGLEPWDDGFALVADADPGPARLYLLRRRP